MSLRSGDLVEVRSAAEILSTLDDHGELEALPFMPEMIPLVGRRFTVAERAEKICDTIEYTGSRRMKDTVFLGELRCSGTAHGGCQAECRLYWKEAWLRRVQPSDPVRLGSADGADALAARIAKRTTKRVEVDGRSEDRFMCQATELLRATTRLGTFDPRAYVRELTSGNVPIKRFLRVIGRAAVQEPLRKAGFVPAVPLPGTREKPIESPRLGLKPGDWVQVKEPHEIAETLNAKGKNRGLWFDREMMVYCGGTYRVRRRINRLIDEPTGKMIELKSDCVTLEGVVCTGDYSHRRWFCPRQIFPYWRETWLRRVDGPSRDVSVEEPRATEPRATEPRAAEPRATSATSQSTPPAPPSQSTPPPPPSQSTPPSP